MITVTVGDTTAEAPDARSAKWLVAKMAKAAAEAQAKKNADYQTANLKARGAGYDVLSRKAGGESMPRGWSLHKPGEPHGTVNETERRFSVGTLYVSYRISTTSGMVTLDCVNREVVGVVENGSGFAFLLFIKDDRDEVTAHAIGTHDGTCAITLVPGVTMAEFVDRTQGADNR